MTGNIPSISISGAPTIEFRFAGDTCTADLAGAHLYAEMRGDGRCDVRITDRDMYVLADLVLNERTEVDMTQNLVDVGSALLWSHFRFTEASVSSSAEKHTDEA